MDYILQTGDVVEQLYFIKTGKVKMSILQETVGHTGFQKFRYSKPAMVNP